jgi:hypothetical protein
MKAITPKNLCAKLRPLNKPYEVWRAGEWTWKVLKKYQTPEKEKSNPFARWFCLVITPFMPHGELGDVYVKDIVRSAVKELDDTPKSA